MGRLLSIVVPAYNAGEFIGPCLRSIAIQEVDDFEVIVVDDASSDRTPEVVGHFTRKYPHFRLVRLDRNRGAHHARTVGFAESSGAFVGFVDADDTVSPVMFGTMLRVAREAGADIAICSIVTEPEGHVLAELPDAVVADDLLGRFVRMEFGTGRVCNKLYGRRVLEENPAMAPGACPGLRRSEDYVVNAGSFHLAGLVATLSDPLYFVREQPDSLSRGTTKSRRLLDQVRACRIGARAYHRWSPEVARALCESFVRRLGFGSARPSFLRMLVLSPLLLAELARIVPLDPTMATALGRRLASNLWNAI